MDKSIIVGLGSSIFLGWMVASLVLPRISDLYGRKPVFFTSMLMHVFVTVGLMLSQDTKVTTFLLFLCGVVAVARWTTGFVWMMEFVSVEKQKVLGPSLNALAALPMIFGTIIVYYT